jgi:hypothetical protein
MQARTQIEKLPQENFITQDGTWRSAEVNGEPADLQHSNGVLASATARKTAKNEEGINLRKAKSKFSSGSFSFLILIVEIISEDKLEIYGEIYSIRLVLSLFSFFNFSLSTSLNFSH